MQWVNEFISKMFSETQIKTNMKKAFQLKYENLPKKLYKYKSFDDNDYSIDNLSENKMWLSNPFSFNDPFECLFKLDYENIKERKLSKGIKDFIESYTFDLDISIDIDQLKYHDNNFYLLMLEMKNNKLYNQKMQEKYKHIKDKKFTFGKLNPDMHNKLHNVILNELKENFKISSFSEVNDSILMWGHYASNHSGFCIEYDIHSLEYNDIMSRYLYPVVYTDKIYNGTKFSYLNTKEKAFYNHHLLLSAIYKSKVWNYEKEWRLIFGYGIMNNELYYNTPKPTALYVGSNTSEKNIFELLKKTHHLDIPIYQMVLDNTYFKLHPKEIGREGLYRGRIIERDI